METKTIIVALLIFLVAVATPGCIFGGSTIKTADEASAAITDVSQDVSSVNENLDSIDESLG